MRQKHNRNVFTPVAIALLMGTLPFAFCAECGNAPHDHKAFLERKSEAKRALDAAGAQYKSFFVQKDDTYSVTLSPSVTNLNALAGLPVSSLKLFMCTNIVDISGITNLPSLRSVHLEGLRGTDLAPLAHTRIEELFLRGTHITDFSPIKGLPLRKLTSNPLVLEYEQVAKRSRWQSKPSWSYVSDILDYLCAVGRKHRIHFLWRPREREHTGSHTGRCGRNELGRTGEGFRRRPLLSRRRGHPADIAVWISCGCQG